MWKNNGQNLGPYGGNDLHAILTVSACNPCMVLESSLAYLSIFLVFSGGVPRVIVVLQTLKA